MSEICLDCWNKLNGTNDPPSKYILSEELDLCEECGEWTHVIVTYRRAYYWHKFRYVLLPFRIILLILYVSWRILISPYLICKYIITKHF